MPVTDLWRFAAPIVMLLASNVFMTLAWYGHLKYKAAPLALAIVASWAIAFLEYCLAVPANRIGSAVYSTAQLKTIQEVITLCVFAGFSVLYLGEGLTWRHALGFALIALGAGVVFSAKAGADVRAPFTVLAPRRAARAFVFAKRAPGRYKAGPPPWSW